MILHLCPRDDWATVSDHYEPASLGVEGFIHCSDPAWVHVPASLFYRGRTDLVLLEIDEAAVDVPVVWEDGSPPDPSGRQFPHVYGRLPALAVTAVHEYQPAADGSFPPWQGGADR
ncbi:DUF952 domain-containing protein [Actinoplanes awajinensis]|uniref:Glutathione S-transferase n=1 Tax=Actinoplanes awajinensis subsp. mycoplanecinus TaxID=135947 RepID=A0A0X3V7L7_9ACTN|nr:DUF952 domain-containing protein [Actinoplanes awajinensis]KUL40574.1 glutathione S-transferase [Actinoplanes awajinensis subsp. mycoplanecinus]